MITDLDSPSSLDPGRVGAKAAALAAARAAGAPVVPGFVVEGSASRHHMGVGTAALATRGSGGARLAVSGEPIDFAPDLIAAGEQIGEQLVARSSTILETSGAWSGAFASYVDIGPPDLPKAVAGCWASAFSVDALERQGAAGVQPGSFPMSVLVQAGLRPEAGGWAEIHEDGSIVAHGVKGSPAPLLQGWVAGAEARFDGKWRGDDLTDLIGPDSLEEIAYILRLTSSKRLGNRCEWAVTDRVWALQVSTATRPKRPVATSHRSEFAGLADLARVLVLAPGAMGEEFVLPWAIAGLPPVDLPTVEFGDSTLAEINELAEALARQVWDAPLADAKTMSIRALSELGDGEAATSIETITALPRADSNTASGLLGRLAAVRAELVRRGSVPNADAAWHLDEQSVETALSGGAIRVSPRVGTGRWEPLVAAITMAAGRRELGTAASPGIGAGVRSTVVDPHRARSIHRGVIDAAQPIPNLASLLWDSAAVVTGAGSPAAHLFEAARALRVPAVCGVDLGQSRRQIVAVDGYSGTVATIELEQEI
ncbi:MAG TPA: PEP-utilizing enzyme [Acidimicrobiia bacterium]|nr:PEP-utilizing enzyme [Acidimicrobiia bacterium]